LDWSVLLGVIVGLSTNMFLIRRFSLSIPEGGPATSSVFIILPITLQVILLIVVQTTSRAISASCKHTSHAVNSLPRPRFPAPERSWDDSDGIGHVELRESAFGPTADVAVDP